MTASTYNIKSDMLTELKASDFKVMSLMDIYDRQIVCLFSKIMLESLSTFYLTGGYYRTGIGLYTDSEYHSSCSVCVDRD